MGRDVFGSTHGALRDYLGSSCHAAEHCRRPQDFLKSVLSFHVHNVDQPVKTLARSFLTRSSIKSSEHTSHLVAFGVAISTPLSSSVASLAARSYGLQALHHKCIAGRERASKALR